MGKGDRKKRGRPRKQGPREPNGRLQRGKGVTLADLERVVDEQSPAQETYRQALRRIGINHTGHVDIATAKLIMRSNTVLRRWGLLKMLNEEQITAAEEYAEARRRYLATQGMPQDTLRGPYSGGGLSVVADSPEAAERAVRAYTWRSEAIRACGRAVVVEMHKAAVHNVKADVALVRHGCDALLRARR